MNRVFSMLTTGLLMACILLPLTSCSKDDSTATDESTTQQIHYTFASKTEGMAELMSNERYYNSLNQADLDWRLHKTGATLDEQVVRQGTGDGIHRRAKGSNKKGYRGDRREAGCPEHTVATP